MAIIKLILNQFLLLLIVCMSVSAADRGNQHKLEHQMETQYPYSLVSKLARSIEGHWHPTLNNDSPFEIFVSFTWTAGKATRIVLEPSLRETEQAKAAAIAAINNAVHDIPLDSSHQSVGCLFGFSSHEADTRIVKDNYGSYRVSQLRPKVWFMRPGIPRTVLQSNPAFTRYWPDGRPDLHPYHNHMEHLLNRDSSIKQGECPTQVTIEINIGKGGEILSKKILESSGSRECDEIVWRDVSTPKYSEIPNPGPQSLRVMIRLDNTTYRIEEFEPIY